MLEFIFDLPLVVVGPALGATLGLLSLAGLIITRRWVLPRLRVSPEDSEFTGSMLQSVMVFYGLAVALIAVSVWQSYSDVSKILSGEATSLASLYRDVSGYPEPTRARLQNELRDYVQYIIHEAWPLQRQGKVPAGGVEHMNQFQAILITFEPPTEGQKLLHAETLRAYDLMIQARRARLDAVSTALPGVMWALIVGGAALGLAAAFFFKVEDARLHAIQVLLLAGFIGIIILMILALDRPFRGDLALGPEPYQLIYDQLMKP